MSAGLWGTVKRAEHMRPSRRTYVPQMRIEKITGLAKSGMEPFLRFQRVEASVAASEFVDEADSG